MAWNTLTITTLSNTTATVTTATSDAPSLKNFVEFLPQQGGVFDDSGVWYPLTAILKIVLS